MVSVIIDWKTVLALGGAASLAIFALKIKHDDARETFIHMMDASKEWASAIKAVAHSEHSGT